MRRRVCIGLIFSVAGWRHDAEVSDFSDKSTMSACIYVSISAAGFRFSRKQLFFGYMCADSNYEATVDAAYLTIGFSMETTVDMLTELTSGRVPMAIYWHTFQLVCITIWTSYLAYPNQTIYPICVTGRITLQICSLQTASSDSQFKQHWTHLRNKHSVVLWCHSNCYLRIILQYNSFSIEFNHINYIKLKQLYRYYAILFQTLLIKKRPTFFRKSAIFFHTCDQLLWRLGYKWKN